MRTAIYRSIAATIAASMACGAAAAASPPTRVSAGDRIRVEMAWTRHEGTVLDVNERGIVLQPERTRGAESREPVRIQWGTFEELKVSRGMGTGAGKGARVGAVSGAILITPLAFVAAGLRNLDCEGNCASGGAIGAATVVGIGVGALMGAGLGAVVGGCMRAEHWEKVRSPQWGLALTPERRGLGASVTVRF